MDVAFAESDRALMTMLSITKEWRKRTCGTFRTAGDIDASTRLGWARLDAFRWDRSIRPLAVGIYELFTSASLIIFSAWSQSSSALVD